MFVIVNVYAELKDTCMVPTNADESPAMLEPSYTFATECFFMTHHTLSLGFRVLHERLVQLNRELHRIQEVYRDISQQGVADSEPAQRLKDDMERSRLLHTITQLLISLSVLASTITGHCLMCPLLFHLLMQLKYVTMQICINRVPMAPGKSWEMNLVLESLGN